MWSKIRTLNFSFGLLMFVLGAVTAYIFAASESTKYIRKFANTGMHPVSITAPEHYGLIIQSDSNANSIQMSPWIESINGIKLDLDNTGFKNGKRVQIRVTTQGLELTDISGDSSLVFQKNAGSEKIFKVDKDANLLLGFKANSSKKATNTLVIANGVPPAKPSTDSGQIFVDNGTLKYLGPNGTVTTLANP